MPRNYITQDKIDQEPGFLITDKDNHARTGAMLPTAYELSRIELENGNFAIVLLDHSSERIAYYVKVSILSDVVLNASPVIQVLLWRTNDVIHETAAAGLARLILFKYLLESYNVVASDSHQTTEGRDFWIRQTGLHVYRFHRINCDLVKIEDHAIIRDNSCNLWGDDVDYCNVLAVISKEAIKDELRAVNC